MKNDIVFHSVDLSDRTILQHYLDVAQKSGSFPEFCDYTFSTLYLWRHFFKAEWAVVDDFLVIRACCFGGDKRFYLQPLCLGDSAAPNANVSYIKNAAALLPA